jgi:hypothetical protein
MKIVHQTADDGLYLGPVEADPSPMEPGVWLIPAGCVEAAPPPTAPGERARWTGAAWTVEPVPAPDPTPRHADEARAALARSDVTVLRCVEAGLPVPADWRAYRQALRAIVSTGLGPVPPAPAYPAGT